MASVVQITNGFGKVSRLQNGTGSDLFIDSEAEPAAKKAIKAGAVQAEISSILRSGDLELTARYKRGETGQAVKVWPTGLSEKKR